ncbi:hypothetical protein [Amycolatopsis sp. cmx-11-51]|uniref:hypothetical protein n=1 Tax=unclassified Amycolatopsis TaxID=2618356 RepID=UPI0039E65622
MSAEDTVSMNGGNVVDMHTVETAHEMTVIDAEGTHLETAWNAIKGTLPEPGTFGHGLIGVVFNSRTSDLDGSVRAAADSVPPAYRNLAAAGQQLVKTYLAHDAEAANFILVQLS